MSSSNSPRRDPPREASRLERFFAELKRRKVLSTAGVYLFVAFVAMQVVNDVVPFIPFVTDAEAAGRVVLLLLVVGFPIAMSAAWILELQPPRLRRELPRGEAERRERAGPAKELRPDTVGVLPFENLSDDREDEYFSDGITDDVMMSLSQIKGLRVIPRTTVRQYKGVSRGSAELGAELGAATLVTGSVRRSGSRARVVVVAIDAGTEDHLWSETYDRELEDIFEVQSEIASNVAEAVARELSPAARRRIEERGTSDAEAYVLYLRARFLWNQRTETSLIESLSLFQRALERDPEFPLAHAGMADAYTILGVYGIRAPKDALVNARAAADRALSIDPTLGEAIADSACVRGILDWDWEGAESGFLQALELSPSYPTAHQWYATNVLAPRKRFAEARDQLDLARDLDPASSAIAVSRGIVSFYERDHDRARREFGEVARLHPRFPLVHFFLGQCHESTGEPERAIESLEWAVELAGESSETVAALGHAFAQAGRTDEALGILRRLEERSKLKYVSEALFARVFIGLGRTDDALDRLDSASEQKATDLIWVGVHPIYDPVRTHPRFIGILEQVGLS